MLDVTDRDEGMIGWRVRVPFPMCEMSTSRHKAIVQRVAVAASAVGVVASDCRSSVRAAAVSVHQRNPHLMASPVIFSFHLVHLVIHRLYCWCLYGLAGLSLVIHWLLRHFCKWRRWTSAAGAGVVVAASSADLTVALCAPPLPPARAVGQLPAADDNELEDNCDDAEMWKTDAADMLSRQKMYHQRAFELISRALKLDEQNGGESSFEPDFAPSIMIWYHFPPYNLCLTAGICPCAVAVKLWSP